MSVCGMSGRFDANLGGTAEAKAFVPAVAGAKAFFVCPFVCKSNI